ncbi:Ankyrin repeat domain-containing protein 1 [Hondaea fermentalgiana]|uniref:Ankyrin repeat domain-containing protein 1 n=1 Tax=Hondaea fermentalgiana TaxID=2315210 RepID=A0A2R5G181_9STRA|nr:Ankyrin repeat domain-containing protein 1 [Hondaea fermentalgiana]|eukprot:GBG24049.1 Ankyrin repeat domain-containing protein 1 [Hondaea fermentalgiana]
MDLRIARVFFVVVAFTSLVGRTQASFESLLDDTIFKLAELDVAFEVPIDLTKVFPSVPDHLRHATMDVSVRNLSCYDVSVGDLWIEPSFGDNENVERAFEAGTKSFSLTCAWASTANVHSSSTITWITSDIAFEMSLMIDNFGVAIALQSENYAESPPTQLMLNSCNIGIDWAKSLDFQVSLGEGLAKYVEAAQDVFYENLFGTTAEALESVLHLNEDDNVVCQLLQDSLASGVDALASFLSEYKVKGNEYVDRLNAEASVAHMNEEWVDFETSDIFGMAFDAFNSEFALDDTGLAQVNSSAADLIRSITQDTGTFAIEAGNATLITTSLGNMFALNLELESIKLVGLDHVSSFSPARVYGPLTVESNISFASLEAEIDLILDLDFLSSVSASQRRRLEQMGISVQREKFRLSLDVNDLTVNLAFAMAINIVRAWDLGFGSVLENPFECVLSTIDFFQAARVWGEVGTFNEVPFLSGLISRDVTTLMQGILEAALHIYGPSGLQALPGILLEQGPDLVSSAFGSLIRNSACPDPAAYQDDEVYFNFSSDSYFRQLVDVVEDDIVPEINEEYIRPMTQSQSGEPGSYVLQEDESMAELSIPVGTFSMSTAEITVSGLDSMYDVHFMENPRPFVLHNSFRMGGPIDSTNDRRLAAANDTSLPPVTLSLVLEINFDGDATNFANKFEFSISFQGLYTNVDFLAKVNRTDFETMSIEQLLDLNCLLARLDDAAIEAFEVSFEAIRVGLRCIECTSPGIAEMERKVQNEEYQDQFTDVMNEWIATIIERFREKIDRAQLAITIEEARQACEGTLTAESSSEEYHAESDSRLSIFGIIGGMALTMIVGMGAGCCLRIGQRGCCLSCRRRLRLLCCPRLRSMSADADEGREASASVSSRGSDDLASRFSDIFRFNSTASDSADIAIAEDALDLDAPSLVRQFGGAAERGKDPVVLEAEFRLMRQRRASLAFHPAVPWYASYGVLGMLSMNAFLFVLGHLIVAANINVLFTVLGDEVLMDNVAGFSIGKSIKDLWDSGIIPLALLLASLSGAFPYIKVLTMLFCWITPPRFLSVTRRGKVLDGFDTVGKWSMIDVYVLLLIMVAFGINIENPRLDILPDGFYAARVFVDPAVGLVCFTAAAMLSLLCNNLLVYFHRNVVDADNQALREPQLAVSVARHLEGKSPVYVDNDTEEVHFEDSCSAAAAAAAAAGASTASAFAAQAVTRQGRRFSTWLESGNDKEELEVVSLRSFALQDGRRLRFTRIGRHSISALLCICALLILVGLVIPSFGFRVLGVIGMFMDIDEVESWKPYSVLDTFMFGARQAFESTNDEPGYIAGVLFLSMSYLVTAAFFPLVTLGGLSYIWLAPLSIRRQKWLYLVTEICSAWSCVDVFVVGLIVGVLELGHISYVLLKPVCKHVLPLINDVLVPTGFVQEENATCLYIASSLEPGCALLVAGALLSNILSQLILRAAHAAIHEREIQEHPPVRDFETPDPKHEGKSGRVGCLLRGCLRLARLLRWIEYLDPEAGSAPDTIVVAAGCDSLRTMTTETEKIEELTAKLVTKAEQVYELSNKVDTERRLREEAETELARTKEMLSALQTAAKTMPEDRDEDNINVATTETDHKVPQAAADLTPWDDAASSETRALAIAERKVKYLERELRQVRKALATMHEEKKLNLSRAARGEDEVTLKTQELKQSNLNLFSRLAGAKKATKLAEATIEKRDRQVCVLTEHVEKLMTALRNEGEAKKIAITKQEELAAALSASKDRNAQLTATNKKLSRHASSIDQQDKMMEKQLQVVDAKYQALYRTHQTNKANAAKSEAKFAKQIEQVSGWVWTSKQRHADLATARNNTFLGVLKLYESIFGKMRTAVVDLQETGLNDDGARALARTIEATVGRTNQRDEANDRIHGKRIDSWEASGKSSPLPYWSEHRPRRSCVLNLSFNEITDKGLKPLMVALAKCRHIAEVDIRGNKITRKSLPYIVHALVYNVTLEAIDMSGNRFTKVDLAEYLARYGSSTPAPAGSDDAAGGAETSASLGNGKNEHGEGSAGTNNDAENANSECEQSDDDSDGIFEDEDDDAEEAELRSYPDTGQLERPRTAAGRLKTSGIGGLLSPVRGTAQAGRSRTPNAAEMRLRSSPWSPKNTSNIQYAPEDMQVAFKFARRGDIGGILNLMKQLENSVSFHANMRQLRTGETATMHAARADQSDMIRLLLEKGANINALSNEGWAALHHAVDAKQASTVKFLLQYRADPNIGAGIGIGTALHLAVRLNRLEAVCVLLDATDIDLQAKDGRGRTPLALATQRKHNQVKRLLTEAIAARESKDAEKSSAEP